MRWNLGSVLPANSEDDGWRSPTLKANMTDCEKCAQWSDLWRRCDESRDKCSDRVIELLDRIAELQQERDAAKECLAAERAVNSQMNACLDESLEVLAATDQTLTKQHAVIETLTERIASYQQLFDDKVKPLCRETLALCGGRQEQQGFID